jgi:MEMO1 family protein
MNDAMLRVEHDSPTRWLGGIVPHAGWICSGAVAADTLATLARSGPVDVVVVFGAVHTPLPLEQAALDSFASWQIPGESAQVASELRERIHQARDLFRIDDRFHLREHAVEVELPLLRQALPSVTIVPVELPLVERAAEMGTSVARRVIESGMRALFLASSALTHYGPAFNFSPAGVGWAGLQWAMANDRRLLDLVQRFEVDRIVREVHEHSNACGGGAIAAMLAACREMGGREVKLLRHTSSYQTLSDVAARQPDSAVGYASVVVK